MPRAAATCPGTRVQIEARIAKNGDALPRAGDLLGSVTSVNPRAGHPVKISMHRQIDRRPMQQARSRFSTEQIIFAVSALVLIAGIQLPVAHYLSPKSGLGYAIGIVGGTLILAQLLYAVRKRVRSLRWLGSVPGWFQTHMMMGIIGPVCILIHCGFSLGATNSNIALFCMLTVAGSGIFGRYFYSKIHHGLYGRKATLSELQERAAELRERSTKLLMMPELANLVENEEQRLLCRRKQPTSQICLTDLKLNYKAVKREQHQR